MITGEGNQPTYSVDEEEPLEKEEKLKEGNLKQNEGEIEENVDYGGNINPDIPFELLENYKEKNIPSVYTQENENEFPCNVLLNQDNEIEYYTVANEEDGYYIWRYTLREGVTKEEADGNPDFWVYK
ncbi:MAG: hypothetical protein K2N63_13145, partial [Lachnospiraceae bacterium]|nr:hypothetical protein [Lachnospiraceae bacterium]